MSQPWLHDLVVCLAAPTQVWSHQDGQIRPGGLPGVYHADRRVLNELVLEVDGKEATTLTSYDDGGDVRVFVAVPRSLGDPGPDPTVRVVRRREVEPGLLRERYSVTSTASTPVSCEISLRIRGVDGHLDQVKAGGTGAGAAPSGVGGPVLTWSDDDLRTVVRAHGAHTRTTDDAVSVEWRVDVPPGGEVVRDLLVTMDADRAAVTAPQVQDTWGSFRAQSADRRLAPVVRRCLEDLRLLRLTMPGSADEFLAAGAPWFLTLFGRDSLWAARMMLPVSSALAGSTLRVLAERQGRRVDADTAEEPGKILHEVRGAASRLDSERDPEFYLPPVYYGTIDATPLWALTLADAHAWGLPDDEVEPLLPALEAALTWQAEHGDADGDHLLEYVDRSGHGLSNQGWKDSGDAVRRSDGSRATAPMALCEVQGYAYAAAIRGADLLESFGRPGTDRWRAWAEQLRDAFRSRFWVEDARGSFPAIALDRDKRPVVSLTSNIGHLLGTGLLDPEEVDAVARRLVAPDMLSGYGIRTMSREAVGYSPTGYHVGSVWPHDTAICLTGLAAEGRTETAVVAESLLASLHAFEGRPPELFAGDEQVPHGSPVPYPAACRPQAWSAASAVALVTAVTGLKPPTQRGAAPTVDPVEPWTFGRTRVEGWRAGATTYALEVDESGSGRVQET